MANPGTPSVSRLVYERCMDDLRWLFRPGLLSILPALPAGGLAFAAAWLPSWAWFFGVLACLLWLSGFLLSRMARLDGFLSFWLFVFYGLCLAGCSLAAFLDSDSRSFLMGFAACLAPCLLFAWIAARFFEVRERLQGYSAPRSYSRRRRDW